MFSARRAPHCAQALCFVSWALLKCVCTDYFIAKLIFYEAAFKSGATAAEQFESKNVSVCIKHEPEYCRGERKRKSDEIKEWQYE